MCWLKHSWMNIPGLWGLFVPTSDCTCRCGGKSKGAGIAVLVSSWMWCCEGALLHRRYWAAGCHSPPESWVVITACGTVITCCQAANPTPSLKMAGFSLQLLLFHNQIWVSVETTNSFLERFFLFFGLLSLQMKSDGRGLEQKVKLGT